MALLHYLNSNAKQLNINVVCFNVEHGIRGASSKKDTQFVKDYCKTHAIPFYGISVDVPTYCKQNAVGMEEGARILRYDAFLNLIKQGKADRVSTAHHLSDDSETLLLNLFRGTSLSGVTGMNDTYNYILRPMLSVSREQIDDYVAKNSIPFVTDETNLIADNKRNFLRLKISPLIKEIFPEYQTSLSRFANLCKRDESFLTRLADSILQLNTDTAQISIEKERAIFDRAVVKAFIHLGLVKDYTKTHVDSVYTLINAKNGKRITLPNDIIAVREYDKITLYVNANPVKDKVIPFALGTFEIGDGVLEITRSYETPNYKTALYFDLEKIPSDAVIRYRKNGDVFNRFGGKKKKLCDYLTDKKIPQRIRDNLVVVASGNNVLVLQQIEISDDIKVDKHTEVVVKLKYTPHV